MSGKEATDRWAVRPKGSNWGDFGRDDQVGKLNFLTPDRVKAAVAEVRKGISFCLSLPLDRPGGRALSPPRSPPVLRPTLKNGVARMNYPVSIDVPEATDLICDDAVVLHTQYSTHWDALSHTGFMFDADGDGVPEKRYYNGFLGDEHIVGPADASGAGSSGTFEAVTTGFAHRLGIDQVAATCVQGRGVMIDLHHHFGREHLAVDFDMLADVMQKDGVSRRKGRHGVPSHRFQPHGPGNERRPPTRSCSQRFCRRWTGATQRLLQWITDSRIVSDCSGQFRRRALPFDSRQAMPARQRRCTSIACSSSASTSANCGI